MTSVPSAIASLLYDHDIVIVPGLGAFVRHDQSARANVITNEFQRPSSSLSFDPLQREENPLLATFLMTGDNITEDEARTTLATFVNDCFAHLKEDGSVTLPGIGVLAYDDQHDWVFEPDAKANFNGEAFGLDDLNPQPVFGISEQDTTREVPPATVPPATVPTHDTGNPHGEPHRHPLRWIVIPLILLVAAGAIFWYLQFMPVTTKPWPQKVPRLPKRDHILVPVDSLKPVDTVEVDTLEVSSGDTLSETPDKGLEVPEVVPQEEGQEAPEVVPQEEDPASTPIQVIVPDAKSRAFIVGGCFAVEQNALNMVTDAREQGCTQAFVMKRGSKFFVCYGQYSTVTDAKAALPEVLAQYNPKAWILTK